MPQLDVSFVCSDPMLADTFTVTRRSDAISTKGRTTPTAGTVYPDVPGVVTQEEPADLMRNPDAQFARKRIFIASAFELRAVTTGNQPDLVTWNGVAYTVVKVLPYSRYGAGIYESIAESASATDPAGS